MKRLNLLLGLVLLLAACGEAAPLPPPATTAAPPPVLAIGLGTTAAPLAELAPLDATDAQVDYVVASAGTLFADLEAGELDAILVHHIPPGSEHWFNPVALDGVVIVVHPDNPVRALSTAEVQAIYNGRVDDWAAVGGDAGPIHTIGRARGAAVRLVFNERIMGAQRATINMVVQPDNQALLAAIAGDPAAIGYSMFGAVGDAVNIVTLDGTRPSPQTLASQDYPLTVPLYFVSPEEPQGPLRAWLAWLQGDEGQQAIGASYGRVR